VQQVDLAHERIAVSSRDVCAVAGLLRVDERDSELSVRSL
jgi:hypothetical protein